MSSTDPDLQPIEANNIIAADVVDGSLVLRRYDGSEESFPLGGIVDSTILQWSLKVTALAGGTNAPGVTQWASLYSKDGQTDLQDLVVDNLDSNGISMGDDYLLSTDGINHRLWFKNTGLYLVNAVLNQNVADLSVFLSPSGGSTKNGPVIISSDAVTYSYGQLIIVVAAADISEAGSLDLGEVLDVVMFNKGVSPHDVTTQLSITKVV